MGDRRGHLGESSGSGETDTCHDEKAPEEKRRAAHGQSAEED